jgi:hypothetical protein
MKGASARAVLMLLASLFTICLGTPLQAASSGTEESAQSDRASRPTEVKKNADHKHHSADRQSGKPAEKLSHDSLGSKDASGTGNVKRAFGAMPPSVANAKAQVVPDRTPATAAAAMTARANDNVHAAADIPEAQPAEDSEVVATDQLNDVDRASQESGQAAAAPAPAAAPAQRAPETMTAATRDESSTESSSWDQTSLIGKIFVGIGTLLTLASAARMFVA